MNLDCSEIYFKHSKFFSAFFIKMNVGATVGMLISIIMSKMTMGENFPGYWLGFIFLGIFFIINIIARLNFIRKGAQPIKFEKDVLILPYNSESTSLKKVPYGDVYSFDVRGKRGKEKLVIDTKNKSYAYPIKDFQGKDAADTFGTILRGRINNLPESVLRWQRIENVQRFITLLSGNKYPATLALLSLLAVVYFIQTLAGVEQNQLILIDLGANLPVLVKTGQWYRLATANFLHANFIHIIANGFALFFIGILLERLIGSLRFLLVFLVSGILGTICSALSAEALLSVGASTSIFGLLGSLGFINWRFRNELPGGYRLPANWWIIILGINVVLPIYIPQIDIAAHLGGIVGGALLTCLLYTNHPSLMVTPSYSMPVKILTIFFSGIFLFGSVQAAVHYFDLEKKGADHVTVSTALLKSQEDAGTLNDVAWWLATAPSSANEILEMALDMATQAVENERNRNHENPGFLDTQATVHYRLGHFDDAVEIQRDVLGREEKATFASQLARFLKARVEQDGPVIFGDVALSDISLRKPDPHDESIVLDLGHPAVQGMDIYAYALDPGEQILGLLRLSIAPDKKRKNYVARISPEVSKLLIKSQKLELALIDVRNCRCSINEGYEWRFWPYDKSIADLP